MRILITGGKGRLGSTLAQRLEHKHTVTAIDQDDLDISDFDHTRAFITEKQPNIVINTAAWTDVDGCAREPEKAIAINGYGAQNVSIAALESNAAIVQVSTNEVFDGTRNAPYMEYDNRAAINAYGKSKIIGERGAAAVNPRHYIVRTAWLFAHGGKNFIQAILNVAELGKSLRVVTDEVANPTYTDDLADAIIQLIATGRYGTYHLTNNGACSRYNFARYALDRAGYADVPIQPISSREWVRASIPPTYAALQNNAAKTVGITLRDWTEAVDAFLQKEGLFRA
jgi:dTDP-4-dehydrorhamnose reductase